MDKFTSPLRTPKDNYYVHFSLTLECGLILSYINAIKKFKPHTRTFKIHFTLPAMCFREYVLYTAVDSGQGTVLHLGFFMDAKNSFT
jgi:hypothetical protein